MNMAKHKKKNNIWNTVTPLSKTLAMILFITLPFVGFYFGTQYQRALDKPYMVDKYKKDKHMPINVGESGTACTMEAKLCPDGTTYVGRQGPNCEFEKCPED